MDTAYAQTGSRIVSPVIKTAERLISALAEHGIRFDPRVFTIKGVEPERFKFILDVNSIPYQELKVKKNILIPSDALQQCQILAKDNMTKGNFLQEYDPHELEKVISGISAVTDKRFLIIKDMLPLEAHTFLKKCNLIKQGLLVETSLSKDGRYNISIPEGLLSMQEKKKIVLAYTETMLGLTGPNAFSKISSQPDTSPKKYETAIIEKKFTDLLFNAIDNKLCSANDTMANFGHYFKSYRLQLAYVTELLSNGDIIRGFNDDFTEQLKELYRKLPDGSFENTAQYIKDHNISERDGAAPVSAIEDERSTVPEKGVDIHGL